MKSLFREFLSALWEVFKLPFFLISEGFQHLAKHNWRKLSLLIAASVILTAIVLLLFFEVTSQSNFCRSCHIMRPYIAAWETSSHNEIGCMRCHTRTGIPGYFQTKFTAIAMIANYATGLYKRSRPWAEIEDKNCLQGGCHESRLLEGKIEFTKGIVFDHAPHLTEARRGRKLRCTSCHSQIVQGEHISVTSTTCYLCHFKNVEAVGREKLAACTKCHSAPPSGEEASTGYDHNKALQQGLACITCHQTMWQGTGQVRLERCRMCHSEPTHIERINDLEFIHEWHIEIRKVDCQRCHDAIEHRQLTTSKLVMENCSSCHEDLHQAKVAVFAGEGSRLLAEPMPDKMYSNGVVCQSCHKNPIADALTIHADKVSCAPCHGDNYLGLVKVWREGFSRRIKELKGVMDRAGIHPRIEEARHDLALVDKGGAWHNPAFADAVLNRVAEVLRNAGVRTSPPANLPEGSRECLKCHNGIAEVPVSPPLSPFDHRAHMAERGVVCSRCHVAADPERINHGDRRKADEDCRTCHHGSPDDNCEPCHQPSRMLYLGVLPNLPEQPSPMAEAEMLCVDCHLEEEGFQSPETSSCLDCHDQETIDHLEFARSELLQAMHNREPADDGAQEVIMLDPGRAVHHPELAKKSLEP